MACLGLLGKILFYPGVEVNSGPPDFIGKNLILVLRSMLMITGQVHNFTKKKLCEKVVENIKFELSFFVHPAFIISQKNE